MASTPSNSDLVKPAATTKKIRAKRKLNFSASDYRSKKKFRLKSDIIIPANPPQLKKDCTSTSSDKETPNLKEVEPIKYLIGQLTWGRLKGFDWWPGRVISHIEAQKSPAVEGSYWIKWFGDSKLSMLPVVCLRPLSEFKESFHLSRMRGLYKKAIIDSLEVAARRCGKVFSKGNKQQSKKGKRGGKKTEPNAVMAKEDEQLSDKEKIEIMVQWAINGFEPSGPDGFAPSEEDMVDIPAPVPQMDLTSEEMTADQKARFGKPINEPNLAEDIKVLFDAVVDGKKKITGICLACGDDKVGTEHPLFEGGLCKECKTSFLENLYLYDEDGSQMYCTICGDGKEVFMCDSTGCFRSYCSLCIGMLCGRNAVREVN